MAKKILFFIVICSISITSLWSSYNEIEDSSFSKLTFQDYCEAFKDAYVNKRLEKLTYTINLKSEAVIGQKRVIKTDKRNAHVDQKTGTLDDLHKIMTSTYKIEDATLDRYGKNSTLKALRLYHESKEIGPIDIIVMSTRGATQLKYEDIQ